MPNPKYRKGANFERELVNEAKAKGCIAFRSAGSKSAVDVCIINPKDRLITFIQAKTGKGRVTKKYKKEFEDLSDEYFVEFKIVNKHKAKK